MLTDDQGLFLRAMHGLGRPCQASEIHESNHRFIHHEDMTDICHSLLYHSDGHYILRLKPPDEVRLISTTLYKSTNGSTKEFSFYLTDRGKTYLRDSGYLDIVSLREENLELRKMLDILSERVWKLEIALEPPSQGDS